MSKTTSITDDELIKDLKCCLLEDCERCKKDWSCVSQWDCMRNLMRHTLNFINRLKAIICDKNILIDCLKNKIERQKATIDRQVKAIQKGYKLVEQQKAEIENLTVACTNYEKALKSLKRIEKKAICEIKSEAIKEVLLTLEAEAESSDKYIREYGDSEVQRAYNKALWKSYNLVKEMAGDKT